MIWFKRLFIFYKQELCIVHLLLCKCWINFLRCIHMRNFISLFNCVYRIQESITAIFMDHQVHFSISCIFFFSASHVLFPWNTFVVLYSKSQAKFWGFSTRHGYELWYTQNQRCLKCTMVKRLNHFLWEKSCPWEYPRRALCLMEATQLQPESAVLMNQNVVSLFKNTLAWNLSGNNCHLHVHDLGILVIPVWHSENWSCSLLQDGMTGFKRFPKFRGPGTEPHLRLIGYLQLFMAFDVLDKSTATPKVSTMDSVRCYTWSRMGQCKIMASHKALINSYKLSWMATH